MLNYAELNAQALNNQIKDVVMPSPNAASLGKYGDIPVSYHTGVPNVGIPIYTLQEGPISLPISLSYHAGGMKVGEPCSWVGLNWSLQAGGMISRMVQGRADESTGGYMSKGQFLTTAGLTSPQVDIVAIAGGSQDGEPDIFSFSVGGYSGKFYIGTQTYSALTGTAVVVPKQDVKVEYFLRAAVGGANRLYKFKVTTPEGVIYEFGDLNDASATPNAPIEISQPAGYFWHANGWYLSRITSPDLASTINLTYIAEEYRQFSKNSPGSTQSNSSGGVLGVNYTDYQGWRLSTITTQSGTLVSPEKVTFVAGSPRTDILQLTSASVANTGKEAKILASITVENGTACKSFNLTQSYWTDNSPNAFVPINGAGLEANKRLRLMSVQEQSCSGTPQITLPATIFTYYNQSGNVDFLPNRYSSAIDHWGYYNGATTNPAGGFNIPYTRVTYYKPDVQKNIDEQMGTSNRETNEASMKLGTLQTITYPTGGNRTFEYEANDYYNPTGIKVLRDTANLNHFWDGGNCGLNNTTTDNILRAFTQVELDNMFYKIDARKATLYTATCADPSPSYQIKVSFSSGAPIACPPASITPSSTILSGAGTNTVIYQIKTITGKLTDLIPCLLPNTTYRFEIVGTNSAVNFTLQQEVTVGTITNRKVGGLRVKKITTNDALNAANNIVKTYDYNVDNVTPAQSTAVLYSKPKYSAVYDAEITHKYYIGTAYVPTSFRFHVFTDYSIVPLGSFEGATVGYSAVKEYSSNGAYTKYTYLQETPQSYDGTPVPPTFPRVNAGNLETKIQKNSGGTTVASETNSIYTTDAYAPNTASFSSNPDRYFKAINHTITQNAPTTFFLEYNIPNKPYRLDSMTSTVDGVTTTTNYTYDTGTRAVLPKRSETVTNSNGMTTTSTYYYANDSTIIANNANNPALISRNMIGFPIKVKQQTGTSVKWTKVEYALFNSTQIEPQYLKECFNADESVATNWITRLQISAYTISGMPSTIYKNNFLAPETYTWDPTYPKLLKKKQFGYLSSTTSLLTWDILYKTGTSLVEKIIDENRLVKRYAYDPLMRLDSIKDRMKADETDIQATTKYDYHYKNSPTDYNYVGTNTTFVNAGNTTPLSTKQYMDGLGRPLSTVRENYTPNALSQKTNVTYDALGRQDKSYQPFEGGTGYEAATTAAFTYATYEASPLSRPIRQYAEDGKFIETRYGTNAATDVQRFIVTTNGDGTNIVSLGTPSLYDVGTLFKTIVLNENWNGSSDDYIGRTEIFKDKLGRVLLSRKFVKDANNVYQNVDTYNVYDDYSNLVMVIPPGAFVPADAVPIKLTLVFEYNYDYRNRLIKKKVPSADVVNFYYDARDLLTLTQDGNMRTSTYGGRTDKYLGTQYNEIGQVVKTGWVYTTAPLSAALTVAILDTNKLTETQYYDNRTWVKNQGAKVLKNTGVVTEREFIWSYIERRIGYEYSGNPIWTGKQHLLSKTYRYGYQLIGDAPIDDNDYGGVNWTVSGYDGAQKPTLTLNYLYSGSSSTHAQEVRQWQTFAYDNGQRLKSSNYMYALFGSGVSSPTDKLSDMNYDIEDRLIEKNTAFINNKYLQSTDFAYNNRGWLTSINSGFLPSATDYPLFNVQTTSSTLAANYASLGTSGYLTPPANSGESNPDLFKEIIRYDNPNAAYPNSRPAQYNGNISQIEWQVAGREAQGYSFKYDNLERLTEAKYTDIHASDWSSKGWITQYGPDNKYNETASYDFRGNIQDLKRLGMSQTAMITTSGTTLLAGYFSYIDDLTYTYDPSNANQLAKVADLYSLTKGFMSVSTTVNGTSTHYAYDKNGNLTRDDNKGITEITYNHLNLPLMITFTNNASAQPRRIEFIYDATGVKLRKTVFVNNVVTDMRNYVNGIEYSGTTAILDRFPHTEGAVVRQSDNSYLHEYVIKDHLGNTRVTYSDANNDGTINNVTSDIKQINSYYPFGLNMEGNFNGAGGSNKYQYNGKEWNDDFGLNLSDYGARYADPAIGRWWNVDPEGESNGQISFSNYHYTFDNPVRFNDPDGKEGEACCGGIGTRILGTLQAVAGATEMAAAAALILAPEPILTKAGGVAVAVHGADNIVAGLSKAFTGKETETLTSQGLQSAGLSKENAQTVDAVIGIAGTGIAGAVSNSTKVTIAASKTPSLVEQGANLVKTNGGKNSVTIKTATQQIRYDLAGKAHAGVATPHKQVYNKNIVEGVVKSISRASKEAVSMTQQEIRAVRKYLEKQ